MYSYIAYVFYENFLITNSLADSIIAYRKIEKKSSVDFGLEVLSEFKKNNLATIYCFDIEKFFDNMDHSLLKKKISEVLNTDLLPEDFYNVYKSVTNYSYIQKPIKPGKNIRKEDPRYMEYERFESLRKQDSPVKAFRENKLIEKNKTGKGIPQGLAISCAFSNIYMMDFDRILENYAKNEKGLYRRYSDDIVLVLPNEYSETVIDFVTQTVNNTALLEINKDKVEVASHTSTGQLADPRSSKLLPSIQYLGITFDGVNFSYRQKSYSKYRRRLKDATVKVILAGLKKKKNPNIKSLYRGFSINKNNGFFSYVKKIAEKTGNYSILENMQNQKVHRNISSSIRKVRKDIIS